MSDEALAAARRILANETRKYGDVQLVARALLAAAETVRDDAQPAPPATMDSAPRDGQHIIVGSTQWGPPRIGQGFEKVHGWYCSYTGEALEPEWWAPLPAGTGEGRRREARRERYRIPDCFCADDIFRLVVPSMTAPAALVERVAQAIYDRGENTWPDRGGPIAWTDAPPPDKVCAHLLARAALAAVESAGYRIVPIQWTEEMVDAGYCWELKDAPSKDCSNTEMEEWWSHLSPEDIWDCMLAAAPSWKESTP